MRRSPRHVRHATTTLAIAAVLATTPGTARAAHDGTLDEADTELATLIVDVAEADQRLANIGAKIQGKQEGVNKALAEVLAARDAAAAARRDVTTSQQQLIDANAAINSAQQRFDDFAAATYTNGPASSLLSASSPEDIIAAAGTGHTLTLSFDQAVADLQRARTTQANRASAARAAQQRADQAAADAQRSQDAAVAALTEAQQQFGAQQTEVDRLATARDEAQARLAAARAPAPASTVAAPSPSALRTGGDRWDQSAPGTPATADAAQWDTTLPMVPSTNIAADPVAIINAVLKISARSVQLTADMGRRLLTKLGILSEPAAAADPGFTNGRIPRAYGPQASEYVVRRAMSQLGVPYSWGGGNASGPSRGIDSGASTVGFDCSGLMLYAFAGVGIKLPHYSGSQYNAGRKVPSSQMRRGDLIFYGPNASQHEAMYLGNGQMLEAPFTGSQVRIAPVRTGGMMPYVTRLIEY